ncbi:MAG: glycosyltransferase family 4 protein [Chloroflexi bacterium]|nr:glycosyltransferase family 4 protein [Chloroflexota bacterium]
MPPATPLIIGIYAHSFPVWSETFIVTKVLGLLEQGFDVQIFVAAPSQHWDRFDILKNRPDVRARVHAPLPFSGSAVVTSGLPRLLGIAVRHPAAFARFLAHCWRWRGENPLGFLKAVYTRAHFVGPRLDILHIEFDTQGLSIVDLKHYFGSKLLLSSRSSYEQSSVIDRFPDAPRTLYRHADGYHFISRFLQAAAARLGLPPSTPWWLIQPAIDLSVFTGRDPATHKAEGAPLRLLSVGRLHWQKGYEFAIDAVALVKAAGVAVEYVILGEGSYREAIEFAAAHYGLLEDGTVKLLGSVPREAVPTYLKEADIFVHAALEEGFANAVIEAQASGLPVVTSDAGGLPENVEDGVTGFVVPRRDARAMAEKILALAGDPALRERMGQAGRRRALDVFDIRRQIDSFADLYRELAGR